MSNVLIIFLYIFAVYGLSNMVDDTEILEIINREPDIEKAARMLIDAANENGGKDNISVVIVEQ